VDRGDLIATQGPVGRRKNGKLITFEPTVENIENKSTGFTNNISVTFRLI